MEYKINKASDDVIENVLLNRNLTFDMVDELLLSDEKNYESPHNYPNIDKAYRRIKKAIDDKEVIYILCDVDNDGFCSAAIIFDFLYNFMNHDDVYYILHEKNRKSHGIDDEIFNKIKEKPCNLLITPDSSSSDREWHEKLYELGCDVVVADHHIFDKNDVFDKAIIVSNQYDEVNNKYGSGTLVSKKLVEYISEKENINIGNSYNDLVAISLVSDVCNLRNLENRYYLNIGSRVENVTNDLIKTFVKKNKIKDRISITDMSFNIINKINVIIRGGTREEMEDLFESLIGSNEVVNYKYKGKTLEESIQSSILRIANRLGQRQRNLIKKTIAEGIHPLTSEDDSLLIIDGKYIDKKISGLLATKLCNEYKKSVMILKEHDGILSGSCRGYGVDSLNELCKSSNLCMSVDGHDNAHGIKILSTNVNDFIQYMNEKIGKLDVVDKIDVDFIYEKNIPLEDVLDLSDLEHLWCNPDILRPKFILKNLVIDSSKINKRGINVSFKSNKILFRKDYCSNDFFKKLICEEENKNQDKDLRMDILFDIRKQDTFAYVNILDVESVVI